MRALERAGVLIVNKVFLSILFLIHFSGMAQGSEENMSNACGSNALSLYEEYRSVLLSSNFNPKDALSMLRVDYKDIIGKGMFHRRFMALRLNEAKVSKILAYNAVCKGDRIYLKMKTVNFDSEYSRRNVTMYVGKGKNFIIDYGDDIPDTSFDEGIEYKNVPSFYFKK